MIRIATWNVNSIKVRLPLVLEWLNKTEVDVLLLQELKCETAQFPEAAFTERGYHAAVIGQKAYNGVALLSRLPLIEQTLNRLPGAPEDEQARYIEAVCRDRNGGNLRIASLYLPNGNPVNSEKYSYKLHWMARLRERAAALLTQDQPVVLGGDFNIIPDSCDVYDPVAWRDDAAFRLPSRAAYREILHLGYVDAWKTLHWKKDQSSPGYTFWDYQAGCWKHDHGLRIDHFLLSPKAADRLCSCKVDRAPRDAERASDHTPLILELQDDL
ncbi:exodeoxyribonuclease III [Azospirillaceae bacterium]